MNKLSQLLDLARNAEGDKPIFNQYGDVRAVKRGTPAVRGVIDLQGDMLPKIETADGTLRRPPNGTPAVENLRIDAAIMKQSVVAQAGASVIVYADPTEAVSDTAGGLVFVRKQRYWETVEAAQFVMIPDGQEVTASPLPISRADIHIDTDSGFQTGTNNYALRMQFSRADLKKYPSIEDAVMLSLTAGLARLADQVLLSAIVAANPAPFSLAAAAAKSLRFDELRAITNGAGAVVGQDGVLRVAGVHAELSADLATGIVGSFQRAAVLVRSEIDVIAERTNVNGELAITCWASMMPLLPDSSRFFAVAA